MKPPEKSPTVAGHPPENWGPVLDFHLHASRILSSVADGEKESFSPLPLRNLTPETEMPFNIYLKCKPKDQSDPEFVLCCPKGQIFQREWHRKLKKLKVPWVYFPLSEDEAVLEFLHGNLKEITPRACRLNPEKAALVLDAMLVWMQHFFTTERGRTGAKLDMALDFIDLVFAAVKRSKNFLSHVMEMSHHDEYLFRHSLNVCIIGLAFINYLGFADKDARSFGVGALLHDLGMIQVPRTILQKPGRLEEEEMRIIRRHPAQSYYMLKHLPAVPVEAIIMAQQHHENGDGSGYPTGLSSGSIHPWAKILRIIDSYESVTAGRPWRKAKSPKETLWDMRHDWEKSQVYDSALLRALIRFLGDRD
jgi:HD-GYP domain-containing protein (c-di-GMP phosphodiesterase class II)